jgi:hypothetical protein
VAFVAMLWQAAQMTAPPSGGWWAATFLAVLDEVCEAELHYPRGGDDRSGVPFPTLVRQRIEQARRADWDTFTACEKFHSAAYLLETVPCVLWILERHAADPEEAIVRAVNDTYDNDTIASIVGAAVGALHGTLHLPRRWRNGLTGRTMLADDGRMQDLLEEARKQFWSAGSDTTP